MTNIPIKIQFVKSLSTAQPSRIVAVKADGDTAFSLWVTDKTGIPYPLKDLQNNVIITNTDGNLQITSSSTSTNINLASSILATINSALQSGDNISELVNNVGYLTTFTETDPVFQASEASLFVSGDKANLDNQSGINSGNQTSIVGISGTKSEFNTSLIDGNFLFVGDVSNTPDATTTSKGVIKLAGDLAGTADVPTVPGLANKVDKVTGKSLIADAEIARLSTVTNQDISSKANDVDVVHKTGNETKSGILTLSDGLKLTGNTTSTTATKLNVQETDGTINTISKSDLVNVVEVNAVPFLPLIGEAGKIYVVKNINKIYRWNGTFYSELAYTDISGKLDLINAKQAGAIGDGVTDDTSILQTYLNNGQGTYIFPKSDYLVSGLDVNSNSKLIFEKGARLILKNNSDRPVLQNKNFSSNVDKNIEIYGLEIEGNEANQIKVGVSAPYVNEPTSGVRFFGVENLKIISAKINKARTYGIWISRVKNGVFRDIEFNQSLLTIDNQDGIHFNGLCYNLDISNIRGVTNDDMIALNANDVAQGVNVSLGEIKNATIRDVVFNNNLNGIRLLSAGNLLDQIYINNLSGNVRDNVVAISSYTLGTANFGSIYIDGVNVTTNTPHNVLGEYGGYILVNDKIDYLKISNVFRKTGADARPTVRIQSRADISKLVIDNITTKINPALTTYYPEISFEAGSIVAQAFLSNVRLMNGVFPNGYCIGATGSAITRLHLENIYAEQIGYGLYLNNTDISTLFVNGTSTNFIRYPFYLVNDSDIGLAVIDNQRWVYSVSSPKVYNILDTSSIVFANSPVENSILKYDDTFNSISSTLKEIGSELTNTSVGNGSALDLDKISGYGSSITLRNSSVLSNALMRLYKPDNVNFYNIYTSSTGLETNGSVTAEAYTATSLPVFENNAAASSLAVGQFYRTSIGVLMVKF